MSCITLNIIIAEPVILDLFVDNGILIIPSYGPGKGEKGADGYTPIKGVDYFDGEKGDDGYTPVKGVDYFDGAKGEKGDPGSDATVTKAKVEEVLTGEISSHSHAADVNKVDKVAGKSLSTNDFTNELKQTYDAAAASLGNILTILQSI